MAETALALMEIEYMRGRLPETLQSTSKALLHALAAGRPREATEAAAARRRAIAKLQTKGNLAAVARLALRATHKVSILPYDDASVSVHG